MSDGAINNVRLVPGLSDQLKVAKSGIEGMTSPDKAKFSELISDLLQSVNATDNDAGKIQEAMINGDAVELHQVMIKAEEAGVAMDLLLEIRNRLINAFNDLVRMPI